jgi:hypothetical protein
MPFETYKTYLAMKQHFTKDKYDYHKYCGRSRATLQAFHKRKDRYFFEKMSRQRPDKEIEDFFLANFVSCRDPETLWIGEIIQEGDKNYTQWQKKVQSLSYIFKEDIDNLFDGKVDEVFDCSNGHPPILKSYLGGYTTLETLVICDRIFGYVENFDKVLQDPVWETVSRRIKKYTPFLNINVPRYKKVLKEAIL